MKLLIAAVTLFVQTSTVALAYDGPKNPIVPADNDPIVATIAQCAIDAGSAMGDDKALDVNDPMTINLCEVRNQHVQARTRLLKNLSRLVETFDGFTNHDHDQNLPVTIESAQTTVKTCLTALTSQQWPHNIEMAMQPERNATFCDNLASQLIEAIIGI